MKLLYVQITTIPSVCLGPDTSIVRPAMVFFLFLVAIVDTWFDGLWVSVLFGLVHVVVLRVGCALGICCA